MLRGSLPSSTGMKDQQSDVAYNSSVSVQPIVDAAWRGRFSIPGLNLDINIAAHVSKNACLKVFEVASIMPDSLCLELIPRLEAWPASFKSSPPTEHSVALFFFSEGRDEEVLDKLLSHAICTDFALKSMIGEAELLIFTSVQLPKKLHRFQGKHYFWGVFRGQQAAASHESDYQIHIQSIRARQIFSPDSGNHRSFEGRPITISSKNSPLAVGKLVTQASKADRRGRRLDDAWQHAKPLDVLRQKAECRYCGFVSSHGGISRLKAHLGGGIPGIRLPGCNKVAPELKKVMAEWFSEWVKNTKALWTKEIRESAAHLDKKGGPHNVAWGHTKSLDLACQKRDRKYFDSESLPGGISHLKVHLGGGDLKMHMEALPKVSPEVKGVMSEWVKSLTASKMRKSQAAALQPERRGRPLDDAWLHAKPLDEARQKTRCNYCGFVSLYGGISRLKAHLGGGCPQMQLQGCPQVSLEVKRVMEQWFNEWAKNSAATWLRKSPASVKPFKRGRPLDDTWEHAILLDEMRQVIKCRYCSFVSKCGGIARLKAHLAGGDPTMQLEGCPHVSPEVKSLMAGGRKKYRKKLKCVTPATVGGVLQGMERTSSGAQWFDKRHHILQETLDEISNTSLKGRLQKLIDEKNANVRKMQFEVQSLESQLASMP